MIAEALASINLQVKEAGFDFVAEEWLIGYGFYRSKFENGGDFSAWILKSETGFLRLLLKVWRDGEKAHVFDSKIGEMNKKDLKFIKTQSKKIEKEMADRNLVVKGHAEKLFKMFEQENCSSEADYLIQKGLKTKHGEVLVTHSTTTNEKILIVPMVDEHNELWGLQYLYRKSDIPKPKAMKKKNYSKRFMPGQRKKGLIHTILANEARPSHDFVYVAEGYATALSINEVVNAACIVAFDVNGLDHAVRIASEKYGSNKILIAADFDGKSFSKNKLNPGMSVAQKIAAKYLVKVVTPVAQFDETTNVDFADLNETERLLCLSVHKDLVGLNFDLREKKRKDPKAKTEKQNEGFKIAEPEVLVDEINPKLERESFVPPDYSWIINPPLKEPIPVEKIKTGILPDRKGEHGEGAAKSTIKNFEVLMNYIGATLRYNIFTKKQEWFIPGVSASQDNYFSVLYAHVIDACVRAGFPSENIDVYLNNLCDKNQFNPVKIWVDSKPWDQRSRLDELYSTIKTEPEYENLKKLFMRRWLLMAIAAAFEPEGIAPSGMLVFQSRQNAGKTFWLKSLVPEVLKLAQDGITLDLKNKDTVIEALSFWLIELGELDGTFKRTEQNSLKAWVTRKNDSIRTPYGRTASNWPRRTVCFGSVNDPNFLTDKTGNRRYWVIPDLGKLNYQHNIDMQQLWAEVATIYRGGEQWWPTDEEMRQMNVSNENFMEHDPLEDALKAKFDWSKYGKDLTASELCDEIMLLNPTKWQINAIASIARALSGYKNPIDRSRKHGRKLWVGAKIDRN